MILRSKAIFFFDAFRKVCWVEDHEITSMSKGISGRRADEFSCLCAKLHGQRTV